MCTKYVDENDVSHYESNQRISEILKFYTNCDGARNSLDTPIVF